MLERAIRAGLRQGLRKGLIGGDRRWLTIGGLAVAIRAVQWLVRGRPQVVRDELAPGETLVITHLAEPS